MKLNWKFLGGWGRGSNRKTFGGIWIFSGTIQQHLVINRPYAKLTPTVTKVASALKCYYDQNFMSRTCMKQKRFPYNLSDVAVPVQVTEMNFGPHKMKILNLQKWCFLSLRYKSDWSCGNLFKPIVLCCDVFLCSVTQTQHLSLCGTFVMALEKKLSPQVLYNLGLLQSI